jgi:predicted phosphodiesterase
MNSEQLIIDCISDTHGLHKRLQLPGGDLLIHAGDCSSGEELEPVLEFLDWLQEQNYAYRVLIAGNHDYQFELIPEHLEEECKKRGIILLNDSGCVIEGIKIWGSPIQPWFGDWAFNRQRGPEIRKHWDLIPTDTEILITHGPPYGILDDVMKNSGANKLVGCEDLSRRIVQTQVKLHVFGHIHENGGHAVLEGRTYVNASTVGERFRFRDPGYIRVAREGKKYAVDITPKGAKKTFSLDA